MGQGSPGKLLGLVQVSKVDIEGDGSAAAAFLRQLKIDFATHGGASLRLSERLQRFPLLGRWVIRLARGIAGPPEE